MAFSSIQLIPKSMAGIAQKLLIWRSNFNCFFS
jgi:hypothetical protein